MRRLLRRLLWLWSRGPSRLRAARERRAGRPIGALEIMVGREATALVVIDLIRDVPNFLARDHVLRQLARQFTLPRHRRRALLL